MHALPIIAKTDTKPPLQVNENEVKYLIELSIHELLNPLCCRVKTMNIHGSNVRVPYYHINNEDIWGATAMIMAEFLKIVQKIIPNPL